MKKLMLIVSIFTMTTHAMDDNWHYLHTDGTLQTLHDAAQKLRDFESTRILNELEVLNKDCLRLSLTKDIQDIHRELPTVTEQYTALNQHAREFFRKESLGVVSTNYEMEKIDTDIRIANILMISITNHLKACDKKIECAPKDVPQ